MSNVRPCTQFEPKTHTYRENGGVVISVTQVLTVAGLMNLNGARSEDVERKQKIGSYVDELVTAMELGGKLEDYEYDPILQPWLDSYLKFKAAMDWRPFLTHGRWIADVNGMPVGFELDMVGNLDGMETIAELKCTANDHPAHSIQLAGYDLCLGEKKRQRAVIRCQEDGSIAKLKPYRDQSDYGVFTSALVVANWRRNNRV